MKKAVFVIVFIIFAHSRAAAQSVSADSLAVNPDRPAKRVKTNALSPPAAVSPIESHLLDPLLCEASGLIEWNGHLLTHNDDKDNAVYQLNKSKGEILRTFKLPTTANVDWEEISQDSHYIYIGDIGNNVTGNRRDLKIYRIPKETFWILPESETISFSFSDQTDFTALKPNNTDFDCEAFIVTDESIFLFTKQWKSKKTSVYELSKTPGTHSARFLTTIDVGGLITGATYLGEQDLIVLCGYSKLLSPFVFLIRDFKETDFAASKTMKIDVSLPFHQIEGIATANGQDFYLVNEKFEKLFISNGQKLHKLDLKLFVESLKVSEKGRSER